MVKMNWGVLVGTNIFLYTFFILNFVTLIVGCNDNEFSCDDWTERRKKATCVPLKERCDGKPQCRTGKDEMDCSLLTNSINVHQVFLLKFTAANYLFKNLFIFLRPMPFQSLVDTFIATIKGVGILYVLRQIHGFWMLV